MSSKCLTKRCTKRGVNLILIVTDAKYYRLVNLMDEADQGNG